MGDLFVIYGNGRHAKVLAEVIEINHDVLDCFLVDDVTNMAPHSHSVKLYSRFDNIEAKMIVGIGDNFVREKVVKTIRQKMGILVHPGSIISPSAKIGEGSVVLAGSVIQANAIIGRHSIINANVTIDHDAIIGDFVNVYPNTYIGGGSMIGDNVDVGAGSVIVRLSEIKAGTSIMPLSLINSNLKGKDDEIK